MLGAAAAVLAANQVALLAGLGLQVGAGSSSSKMGARMRASSSRAAKPRGPGHLLVLWVRLRLAQVLMRQDMGATLLRAQAQGQQHWARGALRLLGTWSTLRQQQQHQRRLRSDLRLQGATPSCWPAACQKTKMIYSASPPAPTLPAAAAQLLRQRRLVAAVASSSRSLAAAGASSTSWGMASSSSRAA
jgi:hypothetical protein